MVSSWRNAAFNDAASNKPTSTSVGMMDMPFSDCFEIYAARQPSPSRHFEKDGLTNMRECL
jgi:hypothetical protein